MKNILFGLLLPVLHFVIQEKTYVREKNIMKNTSFQFVEIKEIDLFRICEFFEPVRKLRDFRFCFKIDTKRATR